MTTANRVPLVLVGLSGGVDSAVAAWRLREAGWRVEAFHMTNWEDDDGYCTASADLQDARRVADELQLPLHTVNFSAEYRDRVFARFLEDHAAGYTPNPDVLCNREVKFGACFDHALRLFALECVQARDHPHPRRCRPRRRIGTHGRPRARAGSGARSHRLPVRPARLGEGGGHEVYAARGPDHAEVTR